jgi:hypothetical protein
MLTQGLPCPSGQSGEAVTVTRSPRGRAVAARDCLVSFGSPGGFTPPV